MHFPGVSGLVSIHWAFTTAAGTLINEQNLLPALQKPSPIRETSYQSDMQIAVPPFLMQKNMGGGILSGNWRMLYSMPSQKTAQHTGLCVFFLQIFQVLQKSGIKHFKNY